MTEQIIGRWDDFELRALRHGHAARVEVAGLAAALGVPVTHFASRILPAGDRGPLMGGESASAGWVTVPEILRAIEARQKQQLSKAEAERVARFALWVAADVRPKLAPGETRSERAAVAVAADDARERLAELAGGAR